MRPSLRPPWLNPKFLLRWHPRAPQSIPRRIATTSSASPAPVDIPKLVLSPGSPHHNSLSTFLAYAKHRSLATNTPTYVGTHYEYMAALSLMRLGFSLLRVGGAWDNGLDLIGHWALAPLREPMRVIIQCKARDVSVGPSNIRELEGSFHGIPPKWKKKDVLGLLVTTRKATKGTLMAIGQSRWPMGFIMVSKAGTIQQFVLAKFKNTGTRKDIQMTWMGSPIFPDRDVLDQDTLDLLRVIEAAGEEREARLRKEAGPMIHTPRKVRIQYSAPAPRGGMVTGKSRQPKIPVEPKVKKAPRPPGRPKGTKNNSKIGRPKGSKNKPKIPVDTG
ncbi:hypothetical protein CC86DRAFT_308188 [Ophiobolus disseminans]|uniref:Required for respiratory growth protein 7, mitochondrial n=1 Tax=Ophiobolus disseminans TaxID=1469910 RepID=A0A6A6ZD87_9PLEO|nr:hypothetical protein CC86DRAFT_308188 [Ophiobolus disseminans]